MLERLEKGYIHIQARGDNVDLYRVGINPQAVRQETFDKESVIEVLEQRKRIVFEAEKTSKVFLGLTVATTVVLFPELLKQHPKNMSLLIFVSAVSFIYTNQQRRKYSTEKIWVEKEIDAIKTHNDL